MIDADSKPLFVTVSTAVTKPERPTLLPVRAICVCLVCCQRAAVGACVLLRGDDLPLLVRVAYSRFRRLDCRETGQLISPRRQQQQRQLGGQQQPWWCCDSRVLVCACVPVGWSAGSSSHRALL